MTARALTAWTVVLSCPGGFVLAQQESRILESRPVNPEDLAPQSRPEPLDAKAPLSPELEQILRVWEGHSAKISRVEGKFVRYEYDRIFTTQKVAIGKYFFESPDKGRMDFRPPETISTEPVELGSIKYSAVKDEATTWICTGKEVLTFNIAEKSYDRLEIPPHQQGARISDGPLPFLFGLPADKMKERYVLQLGEFHKPGSLIHIRAFPLRAEDRREFQRAEVLINPETYLPNAVKLWDPSGNKETVYTFQEHNTKTLPWLSSPFRNPGGFKLRNDHKSSDMERTAEQPSNVLLR